MRDICPICGDKLKRGLSRRHDQLHQLHTGRQRIVHQLILACVSCPFMRAVRPTNPAPPLAEHLPLLRDLMQTHPRGSRERADEKVRSVIEGERIHARGGYSALVEWLRKNRIAESTWFRWRKIYREQGVDGFMPKNNGCKNNFKYGASEAPQKEEVVR